MYSGKPFVGRVVVVAFCIELGVNAWLVSHGEGESPKGQARTIYIHLPLYPQRSCTAPRFIVGIPVLSGTSSADVFPN